MVSKHRLRVTAGNAERVGRACEALVWVLGADPRVQAAYLAWRVAHGLSGRMTVEAFRAAVLRDLDQDLRLVEHLVRDELALPYAWLPQLLLADFRMTVLGEVIGDPGMGLTVTPEPVVGLPRGRRPTDDGRYLLRDVEWFYRARVKQPPDSIRSLAREYAGRSIVQIGIHRVKALLALSTLEPPTK